MGMTRPLHPQSIPSRLPLDTTTTKSGTKTTKDLLYIILKVSSWSSSFEEHLELLDARAADLLIRQRPRDHPLLARLHLLHPLLHGVLRHVGQELLSYVCYMGITGVMHLKMISDFNYLDDESPDLDRSFLPDAVDPHDSLLLHCRIPPWILYQHRSC